LPEKFPERILDYGSAVRRLRQERDMTSEALAGAAQVSPSYLSEVERGLKRPSMDVLAKLARAFGMLPSQLLEHVETLTAGPQMVAQSLEPPRARQERARTRAELDFPKERASSGAKSQILQTVSAPMVTPVPRSAKEQVAALADEANRRIEELFGASALVPVDVGGGGYYEWRDLGDSRGPLRYRALQSFRNFQDALEGIFSRHDPVLAGTYLAQEVFKVVDQRGHTQMSSLAQARALVTRFVTESLQNLADMPDEFAGQVLVLPDTSVLVDYPDLGEYHLRLPRVRIMLTATILSELDALKGHRERDKGVQQHARRIIRHLVEWGNQGDLFRGVPISARVTLMTRAREPQNGGLPSWLDFSVPDDRFIASVLETAWDYPKAGIVVISQDFNVVNKARFAGVAAVHSMSYFPANDDTGVDAAP
jgi:transcriptional regulator with XRE-family HTH domain